MSNRTMKSLKTLLSDRKYSRPISQQEFDEMVGISDKIILSSSDNDGHGTRAEMYMYCKGVLLEIEYNDYYNHSFSTLDIDKESAKRIISFLRNKYNLQ